jgi:membrane protease YdiL (CAAX protease family)
LAAEIQPTTSSGSFFFEETMGPESEDPTSEAPSGPEKPAVLFGTPRPDDMNWVFFGSHGLRAGWSLLIFGFLLFVLAPVFGTILSFLVFDVKKLTIVPGTPLNTILGEGQWVAALLAATLIIAALERRRVTDYYLAGPKRFSLFLGGLAAGFIAVSVLIGILSQGGWVHFGPVALSGMRIFKYALMWGIAFVLVALFEEGTFRCYLLSTFARGINVWWALASVAPICLWLALTSTGHGAWGTYAVAIAGLFPCLYFEWTKSPQRAFWQAAWVTSVGFGFIHTFNNGENWIGVLAASAIGFVFCVSVRVTGSAWWAIGCHTAWDWAESYFYGTADSGFAARGHLMTTVPAGSPLWSGGADGPEGSVLVFLVMLLLLMALYILYGRQKPATAPQRAAQPLAG